MRPNALPSLAVFAAVLASALPAQNLIVNGSFENVTTGGCQLNLSNAQFTAAVDNATGFGIADELDLLRDPQGCNFGSAPVNGITKVGIHTTHISGKIDAFSLDLNTPVVQGSSYQLSFYVEAEFQFDPDLGAVEVGLSNDPLQFGTLIYSGTGNPNGTWTKLSHGFVAPISANFLTVRNDHYAKSWNFVDDFVLQPGAGCTERNGSGINATGFACLTQPLVGTSWTLGVPVNTTTVGAYVGLAVTPSSGIPVLGGELLLGVTPPPIFLAGSGVFQLALPTMAGLEGVTIYAQGFRLDDPGSGATLVFTNALDVIIGS